MGALLGRMSDIKKEILARRAAIERLRGELATLEAAAQVLGIESASKAKTPAKTSHLADAPARRGRRTGSISKEWRSVLEALYIFGGRHSYDDVHNAAEMVNLIVSKGAARDRVRHFVKLGFMDGDTETGFEVTDSAAKKFGFAAKENGEARASPDTEGVTAPSNESAGYPEQDSMH